jgi:outer membrane protein, multidrug efflux system
VSRPLVLVSIIVLGACAGPRPKAPPQAAVVAPEAWRAGANTTENAVSATWWETFGDPILTRSVEIALANNVDLSVAVSRVIEARAQFNLAHAQRLPDIVGAVGGGRDRDVNPGFGIPEQQTAGEAVVSVSYDADFFGRLAATSKAARSAMLASEAARDNVRLGVAASTASGYITLRALDARLRVLRDTLIQRADSLKIARRRAEAGYSTELDLAQSEADYRATEQQIPATELAIIRQEDGLSVLLGENPRAIERGLDLYALALPRVPVVLPAALLRRRPDIVTAEEQLVGADHSLSAVRAAFMPDVQISAAGGLQGSTLITSPVWIWSLGSSIVTPLIDSGRLRAQQAIIAAQRDQAAFAYRKDALNAFREVEDALAAIPHLEDQERALTAQRDALAHALALATNRYRAGYTPYLDQLDAERGLLTVELAMVQLRTDRLTALVTLYQVVGGGWQEPPALQADAPLAAQQHSRLRE